MLKIVVIFCVAVAFSSGSAVRKPSSCSYPFLYKGQNYTECVKLDSKFYWCSVYPVYNGSFSYCQEDHTDQVTDEHFFELMKRSEDAVQRLNKLKSLMSETDNQCSACIDMMKTISVTITDQSMIFMDQNKRLLGLIDQHAQLQEVVNKIKKFYQQRRCKQSSEGIEYLGKVSVTASGFQCQDWSAQTPNKHEYKEADRYADNSIKLAKNYCRNPSQDGAPWCYVIKSQKTWENCVIPECNIDCKVDEKTESSLPLCDSFPSSKCPKDSIFFNNYCYMKYETPLTYADAEKKCVENNGHLASVHSTSENVFVAKTVFPGSASFYIGLNDIKTEGSFQWTDESAANYIKFYAGEPNNGGNEDCIQMGRYPAMREAWNDISCDSKMGFVCKFKPIPIQ